MHMLVHALRCKHTLTHLDTITQISVDFSLKEKDISLSQNYHHYHYIDESPSASHTGSLFLSFIMCCAVFLTHFFTKIRQLPDNMYNCSDHGSFRSWLT